MLRSNTNRVYVNKKIYHKRKKHHPTENLDADTISVYACMCVFKGTSTNYVVERGEGNPLLSHYGGAPVKNLVQKIYRSRYVVTTVGPPRLRSLWMVP